MNIIIIFEPRWHDRKLLIANWKIGQENQIIVKHPDFPQPFYATDKQLKSYPIEIIKSKNHQLVEMRVVPINDLSTDLAIKEL